jgi:hypothetical protein
MIDDIAGTILIMLLCASIVLLPAVCDMVL